MLLAHAAKGNGEWEVREYPASLNLPQALWVLSFQAPEQGVPLFQLRWQKNMYFSWKHKSLCHLPLNGNYISLINYRSFILMKLGQMLTSLSFPKSVGGFFAFCSFRESVCFLTLYFTLPLLSLFNENMKQKRAYFIFADIITRVIFNFGFCKYSASSLQEGKKSVFRNRKQDCVMGSLSLCVSIRDFKEDKTPEAHSI